MIRAYIALGSNLAEPHQQIRSAFHALATLPDSIFVAHSSLYCTQPLGSPHQPDYINAAVAIDTHLAPEALLQQTQYIEQQHGRTRQPVRWSPRTLDLDILLYGEQLINTEHLTIPHYDMKNRDFMLFPLAEIAPDLCFPDGVPLSSLLTRFNAATLIKLPEA